MHRPGGGSVIEKGVFSYVYKSQEVKEPVPSPKPVVAPLPESTTKKIGELVKKMAEVPNPRETAWNFINDNRALETTLKVLTVGTIVSLAVVTVKSAGTTAPATLPLIIASGILLSVTWSFDPNLPPPSGT